MKWLLTHNHISSKQSFFIQPQWAVVCGKSRKLQHFLDTAEDALSLKKFGATKKYACQYCKPNYNQPIINIGLAEAEDAFVSDFCVQRK
jgi:hypothetical protein